MQANLLKNEAGAKRGKRGAMEERDVRESQGVNAWRVSGHERGKSACGEMRFIARGTKRKQVEGKRSGSGSERHPYVLRLT